MKLTAEALRDFLAHLPHYDSLAVPERRALATIERPSHSCSAYVVRDSLSQLMAAGFLLPPMPNSRCAVAPDRHEFIRTLRLLWKHGVFENPGQRSFEGYMNDLFTSEERDRFRSEVKVGHHDHNLVLYREVTSPDWVQSFLISQDGHWESPYKSPGSPDLFARPEVRSGAGKLVRWLMDRGRPAPLGQLAKTLSDPELLCASLYACLRYALLFVSISPATMDAVVGVWPTMTTTGETSAIPLPQSVTPAEIYDPLFLVEDMAVLLVACATEPLPLRASDGELYVKTVRELSTSLRPNPAWVSEPLQLKDAQGRLFDASWNLRRLQFIYTESFPGRMLVSDSGRAWLALSVGDRLRVVMDIFLNRKQSVAAFRDFSISGFGSTGIRMHVGTSVRPLPDFDAAILKPFRALEGDRFYPLQEVVAYAQGTNPMLAIWRKDKNAYFSSDVMYLNRTDAEKLREAWSATLHAFLRGRFLPLGGARLGNGKEGISIAITAAGRYYLGQIRDWQWATAADVQVIVQPNFEVTFLGEAPAAAAEIARFAERRGGQAMGALFQITKKSIVAAAVSGMTAEAVLKTLDRVCTRELPANVRREIQGWFGQCRKVSFEATMLVRCQDRETALRVKALAPQAMKPLNDTVLEYREQDLDSKDRTRLVKKLRELGMLVSVHESVGQPNNRGKYW